MVYNKAAIRSQEELKNDKNQLQDTYRRCESSTQHG